MNSLTSTTVHASLVRPTSHAKPALVQMRHAVESMVTALERLGLLSSDASFDDFERCMARLEGPDSDGPSEDENTRPTVPCIPVFEEQEAA